MVLLVVEVGICDAKELPRGVGGTELGASTSKLAAFGASGLGVVMLDTSSIGEKGVVPKRDWGVYDCM